MAPIMTAGGLLAKGPWFGRWLLPSARRRRSVRAVAERLAQRVLDAYGGEERWRAATAVEARLTIGGLLFRWKRRSHGKWPSVQIRVETSEPRTRFDPIDRKGNVVVMNGHSIRIERPDGTVVEERENARIKPYGANLFAWDVVDIGYFFGYTMWNYLALPALLLREDIQWSEVSPDTLEARFPPEIPTHSEIQRFHIDLETGRLKQHDYTAEPFGGWAKAAHMIREHRDFDGLNAPSKRRVMPLDPIKGGPLPFPLLIWADVHEYRLV
jgi:hypothetical protein